MNDITLVDIISLVGSIALVVFTAVLVYITREYKNETKLIRLANQKPIFSLEPTTYSLGGSFHHLTLVNVGQTATQIYLDCKYGNEKKKFFILSLSQNGRAFLHNIPIAKIIQEKLLFTVTITCKDSKDEDVLKSLTFDFNDILKDDRILAYQYSDLGNIIDNLEYIKKEIKQLNSFLMKLTYSSRPIFRIEFNEIVTPLRIGNNQNIIINLKDPITTESIIGATIIFKLITPGGSAYPDESISDENGSAQLTYDLKKISELGRYKLAIFSEPHGYKPNLVTLDFDVIED